MTKEDNKCEHCGYEWPYSGNMPEGSYVTCPACQHKTELVVSEVES